MLNSHSHLVITQSHRFTLLDILSRLLTDKRLLNELIIACMITNEAKQHIPAITSEVLQKMADDYRLQNNLADENDTMAWLIANRLTSDEFAQNIVHDWQKNKVIELVTAEKIEAHFLANKHHLNKASLAKLKVQDEGIAWELHFAIKEKKLSFDHAARHFSVDEASRQLSGHIGILHFFELTPSLRKTIFALREHQVSEPVSVATGWELYYLHEHFPAVLDQHTIAIVKSLLFNEWLDSQMKNMITLTLDALSERASDSIA